MANYHCLLFDADGTLLDFDKAEEKALLATLQQNNLPADAQIVAQYKEINKKLWEELEYGRMTQNKLCTLRFAKLLNALGLKGDSALLNQMYHNNLSLQCDVFEQAEELLKELSEVATLILVTNGFEKVQMARIQGSGLAKYFDAIYVSGRIGVAKPNRKIFDIALEQMGIQNREKVLVIGDSIGSDIKGGANAKLDTCWLNVNNIENKTNVVPTYTVESYSQLYPIIMEQEELYNVGNKEKRHFVSVIEQN